MYGVVRRVLRDPSQAEEVTQEIFVEIWKQAARFDPSAASVRTWAVTIAHRRAVDRVRSEQSHRDRQATVGAASLDVPPTPEDDAIDADDRTGRAPRWPRCRRPSARRSSSRSTTG